MSHSRSANANAVSAASAASSRLLGAASVDVEAYVVELDRVSEPVSNRVNVLGLEVVWEAGEVMPEADHADELARLGRAHRGGFEPRPHVHEAGGLELLARVPGAREVPRAAPAGDVLGERLLCRHFARHLV